MQQQQLRHLDPPSTSNHPVIRRPPPPPPPHPHPRPPRPPEGRATTAGALPASRNSEVRALLRQTQVVGWSQGGVRGEEIQQQQPLLQQPPPQQRHGLQQNMEHQGQNNGNHLNHLDEDELDSDYEEQNDDDNDDAEEIEVEEDQDDAENNGHVVQQNLAAPWVLQVLFPSPNLHGRILNGDHAGQPLNQQDRTRLTRNNHDHGVLRKFHIDSNNMTPSILGDCIAQVSAATTASRRHQTIVGLFRQSDGVFVSLHDILAFPDESTQHIYTIMTPEEQLDLRCDDDGNDNWKLSRYLLWSILGAAVSVGSWFLTKELSELVWLFIVDTHYLFLELPLQQFYHLGPYWLGGWEGDRLPNICTRITYHGDVEFWTRNYHDCEMIYQKKLHAFLFVAKPICYLILGLVSYYIIQGIVIAALQRRRQQHEFDQPTREMIETYHAVNTLFRQFSVQQEQQRQKVYPAHK